MKKSFLFVLLVFCCCGCGWFFKPHLVPSAVQQKIKKDLSIEVFNADVMNRGGKLFIEPFKAGVDAEASIVLDHIAATVNQGATDVIIEGVGWSLSPEEDSDLVLRGYIEKFITPGKIRRMLPGRKNASLRIRIELKDRRTGAVVALGCGWKKMKYAAEDIDRAAYEIGRDIVTGFFRK